MARPTRPNVLKRRADRLAAEAERRADRLYAALVEPEPFGMVRLSEVEALRRYLQARESGALLGMRRSMGGDYPDDEVDKWATRMRRLEAKYLPGQVATEFIREVQGDPAPMSDAQFVSGAGASSPGVGLETPAPAPITPEASDGLP